MLDHVSVAVRDLDRSLVFYEAALRPPGIERLKTYLDEAGAPRHVGFGSGGMPYFWVGRGEAIQGYVHVALAAKDRAAVYAFHEAALAAGGRENGKPGPRPQYHPGYYGAFVLDPDGCNVEAVHHGF